MKFSIDIHLSFGKPPADRDGDATGYLVDPYPHAGFQTPGTHEGGFDD